jgi:GAF domain-containing protein
MNNPSSANKLTNLEIENSVTFNYGGWRERYILSILRIATVLGVALMVFSYSTSTTSARILFITLYAILLAVTILPVPYSIRAHALLAINYAVGLNALFEWGPYIDGSIFLLVFVILAALLFDTKVDIIALVISISSMVGLAMLSQTGLLKPNSPIAPIPTARDWAIYLADFSILGIALVVAIEQFKAEFASTIEQMQRTFQSLIIEGTKLKERVQERTEQLETKTVQLRSTTNIARNVAETQNVSELIETVVISAAEQFGYYHVGLFLLDEGKKNAFLQASSSITGKQLIGQGFRIEQDRRNAISLVAEQKRPYIASDTGNSVFIKDPNFPLTRSRMALPLTVRGDVIGVLDLHSDQMQAFSQDDAEIIQTLVDLVAISIDNVRLIDETRALVMQLESFTSTQTSEIWTKISSRHIPAYQYTPAGVRPLFSPSKPDTSDDRLKIPLILHGQNIGNIKLHRRGMEVNWSEKERELLGKIADQVALALENSRLVDEAQKSAQRDQMIANISSRVRETLDVESVIRTAATELRKVFDLKEAEISIGSPKAAPPRVRKNTSSLKLR